ncbi:MAG: hypothetical protein JOZ16_18795 [Methylobacteriaceae bacterium]|nr:hypothetical protein [Methylobacteriaceae bacterium]
MFSYHARRRNLAPQQAVYRALFCEPGSQCCRPIHVSKAYLGHLRGKRSRSVSVEGSKRILVDAGRTRTAAAVNECAAKFLANADPGAKPIVVHGPSWLLLEEESWFCLWHRLTESNDLRGRVDALVHGDFIFETVRFPNNGDIAVWQRWLFRNEEDYVAASGLAGMQPCDDVELPKSSTF